MPAVLQGAFSKKKPKDSPYIPTYDEVREGMMGKHGSSVFDRAAEEDTFVTDYWWKKPPGQDAKPSKEIVYGGERVLTGNSSADILDELKEFSGDIDQWQASAHKVE